MPRSHGWSTRCRPDSNAKQHCKAAAALTRALATFRASGYARLMLALASAQDRRFREGGRPARGTHLSAAPTRKRRSPTASRWCAVDWASAELMTPPSRSTLKTAESATSGRGQGEMAEQEDDDGAVAGEDGAGAQAGRGGGQCHTRHHLFEQEWLSDSLLRPRIPSPLPHPENVKAPNNMLATVPGFLRPSR